MYEGESVRCHPSGTRMHLWSLLYFAAEDVEWRCAVFTSEAIHDEPTGAEKIDTDADASSSVGISVTSPHVTAFEKLSLPYNKMRGFRASNTCAIRAEGW